MPNTGRSEPKRPFKPQKKPNQPGSPGRKSARWPKAIKVIAEGVARSYAKTIDNMIEERKQLSKEELWRRVEVAAPGITTYIEETRTGEDLKKNLHNRVYKMYYSGTSDRGPDHDPETRARMSDEHWQNWPDSIHWKPLWARAYDGQLIEDWEEWL